MAKARLFIMLLFLCMWTATAKTEDAAVASVVYLRQNVIKTVKQDGQEYQLFLKIPNQDVYKPFFDIHSGTGFLIGVENHFYIVTASHVAKQLTLSALAVIRGENDRPIAILLSDLVAPHTNLNWIFHPQADVAVLLITTTNSAVYQKLKNHFLPSAVLVQDELAPDRELELTIIGFPLNLGVKGRFSPISKTSKSASGLLSLPRGDTRTRATFFLLQDPSVGGFSGAPVFLKPGAIIKGRSMEQRKGYSYLGMVHGTISDNTGGKLALVIPAKYIVDTLRRAEQSRQVHVTTGQPEDSGDNK